MMLNDEQKKEMLADAKDQERRKAFAQARSRVMNQPMTGQEYMNFVQSVQNLFPTPNKPHKIEGTMFKL